MRDGFIKVAAVTPDIRVADCEYNAEQICKKMKEAAALGSKIIVFPELCITGYTCEDLFWQEVLLNGAKDALDQIRKESREIDALVFVGLPWEWKGKLYNVAAAICMADCWDWCRKRIFRIILSFMRCVILSRQTKN